MEPFQIMGLLAIFSAIVGGIFSTLFGSTEAYWATQALAAVIGAIGAVSFFWL